MDIDKMINFIHIPKNAGMAIRKNPKIKVSTSTPNKFVNLEYKQKLEEAMNEYGEGFGYEHARWRDLHPTYQKNSSFAIIRNPWSKVVSRYTFMMRSFYRPGNLVITNPYYKEVSFDEFLEERHFWEGKPYFWHRAIHGWFPQKDHVTDGKGELKCDIVRFEHLNEDVMKYFNLKESIPYRNISNGQR